MQPSHLNSFDAAALSESAGLVADCAFEHAQMKPDVGPDTWKEQLGPSQPADAFFPQ